MIAGRCLVKCSLRYYGGPGMRKLCMLVTLLLVEMCIGQSRAAEPARSQLPDELQQTAPPKLPQPGWSYSPETGTVFTSGDFRWTTAGYAERLFDPNGPDQWRRVRQSSEFAFPRLTDSLRPVFVYEVDFTNNKFFQEGSARKIFENLFVALQNPDDPSRFRILFGENTHVMSREDNLPSGNLPTINRSLILEEHNARGIFGTQFGIEAQMALTDRINLAVGVQDNRGSLNKDLPRYDIGNSWSARISNALIKDGQAGQKLVVGFGIDNTRDIQNDRFALLTAIGQTSLGGVPVAGDKNSIASDIAYTFPILGHPITLEAEAIYSDFSNSRTAVAGGYIMGQVSLFDTDNAGALYPFVRYDLVRLSQDGIDGRAVQQAWRIGFNYNLPHMAKLVNFHVEWAHNVVDGPAQIVTGPRVVDEFRLELRASLTPYVRP